MVSPYGYVRQPCISQGQVVFVADGHLWLRDSQGLRRLVLGHAPRLCPEARHLAFARRGDLWVMDLSTWEVRQLTWWGQGDLWPCAFRQEQIIFASTAQDAFERPQLYQVQLQGGEAMPFCKGEFDAVAFRPEGLCLGRHVQDTATHLWKGYRGGQHGSMWLEEAGTWRCLRLADPAGKGYMKMSCPMVHKDRLIFVSDVDGSGNLWSCDLQGQDLKKHTQHKVQDVRWASGDGQAIVYTWAGRLWHLTDLDATPQELETFLGPVDPLEPHVTATDCTQEVILHPRGHLAACLCNGHVYELPLQEGSALLRAEGCAAMEYLQSGRLVTVSDDLPQWSLTIHPAYPSNNDLLETLTELLPLQHLTCEVRGQVVDLVASPAHDALLMTTSRNELWLVDFEANGARPTPRAPRACTEQELKLRACRVDGSDWEDGVSDPCWSPDGRWLAYCRREEAQGASVVLYDLKEKCKTLVADSAFTNFCPQFDPKGRYLAFLSRRCFAPMEDEVTGDMSFAHGCEQPFLVLLQKQQANPFLKEALAPSQEEEPEEEEEEDADDGKEKLKDVVIDLDQLPARLLAFPVTAGRYGGCAWTPGGDLVYLRATPKPLSVYEDDSEEEEEPHVLMSFNLRKGKEERLYEEVVSFSMSMSSPDLILCTSEGEYLAMAAKAREEEEEDEETGRLDLSRIVLRQSFEREKQRTFRQVKEFVEERLFDPDCGGQDWPQLCQSYAELLPRCRGREDLEDVLRELLAELGLSHVSLDLDEPGEQEVCSASLGLECSWREMKPLGAYEITGLVVGDVWDLRCSGPGARPGTLELGALVLAINGLPVCKGKSLDQMVQEASCEVLVTYVPREDVEAFTALQKQLALQGLQALREVCEEKGKKGKKKSGNRKAEPKLSALLGRLGLEAPWRSVRLRAARCLRAARLRDLVEAKGSRVREVTEGRVGYLLVPDTIRLGVAEFHRHFQRESSKGALIIDLRCNSGGYAAELFLKQLQMAPLGWTVPRPPQRPVRCPETSCAGRFVVLVDENTCSDAEFWADAIQRSGTKVIGVRTWGGVTATGAADLELPHGQLTLPDSHYFANGAGYALENWGVTPDMEVAWPPNAEDPQLAVAIEEALKLLPADEGPAIPRFPCTRLHRA